MADLPPALSGLPPPPASEDLIQIDAGTLKDRSNSQVPDEPNYYETQNELEHNTESVIEEEEEVKSHSHTPDRERPLLSSDSQNGQYFDNNETDTQNIENDMKLSLQCMEKGQLPFNVFYEDLDTVTLSAYMTGIPTGLEGLKRRLIEENGLKFEGIFRLRGKEINLQSAKQCLKDLECISHITATPIEVAQLIKAFYRNLPCDEPGFIPNALLSAESDSQIIASFGQLSEPRKSLLLWTFDLWITIEEYKPFNKMTLQSMSIVFSPNMVRCKDPNPMVFLELQKRVQRVIHDAAKLRSEHRLIVSDQIDCVVPFQKDRSVNNDGANATGPKYAKWVPKNQNGISEFFKNCIVL